jgi:D-sedoheptulose 7-phosphate isomerase
MLSMSHAPSSKDLILGYSSRLQELLASFDWYSVNLLAHDMLRCWQEKRQVFFCGNGGSAGNAVHLANDFLYGIAKKTGGGLKVQSLSANSAVMTCLANDLGYESIFSEQLAVQAQAGDLLIVLSGSGNSPNIVRAIEQAKVMKVKTYAILGFTGGKCKELVDVPIHFPVNDMQIAEDMQLIVGHMVMQWLYSNRPQ